MVQGSIQEGKQRSEHPAFPKSQQVLSHQGSTKTKPIKTGKQEEGIMPKTSIISNISDLVGYFDLSAKNGDTLTKALELKHEALRLRGELHTNGQNRAKLAARAEVALSELSEYETDENTKEARSALRGCISAKRAVERAETWASMPDKKKETVRKERAIKNAAKVIAKFGEKDVLAELSSLMAKDAPAKAPKASKKQSKTA